MLKQIVEGVSGRCVRGHGSAYQECASLETRAVVATDSVSAHADYDNGFAAFSRKACAGREPRGGHIEVRRKLASS